MVSWFFVFKLSFYCNLTVAEQIAGTDAKVIGCNDETGLKQGANYFEYSFMFVKIHIMHPSQARNAYTNCKGLF